MDLSPKARTATICCAWSATSSREIRRPRQLPPVRAAPDLRGHQASYKESSSGSYCYFRFFYKLTPIVPFVAVPHSCSNGRCRRFTCCMSRCRPSCKFVSWRREQENAIAEIIKFHDGSVDGCMFIGLLEYSQQVARRGRQHPQVSRSG